MYIYVKADTYVTVHIDRLLNAYEIEENYNGTDLSAFLSG